MIVYGKNGDALCCVCGEHWDNHGLGGNCNRTALGTQARNQMHAIYTTKKPVKGSEGTKSNA